MNKHRKSWSHQERLEILSHAEQHGVSRSSVEYGVSSSIIYRWQKELPGTSKNSDELTVLHRQLKEKEREISQLKQIVADQALTLKIREDLLKKKILKKTS